MMVCRYEVPKQVGLLAHRKSPPELPREPLIKSPELGVGRRLDQEARRALSFIELALRTVFISMSFEQLSHTTGQVSSIC